MSYSILINPSAKEVRLMKNIESFIPPKEITFLPFFGKERSIDEDNVFFMFENGELKKFRGLYVVVGLEINYELLKNIKDKIIWCNVNSI